MKRYILITIPFAFLIVIALLVASVPGEDPIDKIDRIFDTIEHLFSRLYALKENTFILWLSGAITGFLGGAHIDGGVRRLWGKAGRKVAETTKTVMSNSNNHEN